MRYSPCPLNPNLKLNLADWYQALNEGFKLAQMYDISPSLCWTLTESARNFRKVD